jgi:hypothetical protein
VKKQSLVQRELKVREQKKKKKKKREDNLIGQRAHDTSSDGGVPSNLHICTCDASLGLSVKAP